MSSLTNLPPTYVLAAAVVVLGYFLYRAALPKPIPGIPHHKKSAQSIWGDVPSLLKHQKNHPQVFDWMTAQALELNSPIFQLFINPFGRPKVFIVDHRESTDILLRRSKDFDRSNFFGDIFVGTIPEHHIVGPTNERFKAQRKLLSDTMSPSFLNNVAAKHLYAHTLHLMELWRVKSKVAQGHPFAVDEDLNHMALDAIWAVSFGTDINTVKDEADFLQKTHISTSTNIDEVVDLPCPERPAAFNALMALSDAMETSVKSPFPRQAHWFLRQFPGLKRAKAAKDALIQARLDDAKLRLLHPDSRDEDIDCATDHMVFREQQAADREGRAPQFDTPAAKDELFGFLIGGHDTTASTSMWGIKNITDHPEVQSKLRAALHEAYPEAVKTHTLPTAAQISSTDVPYLDAVLEEMVRKALTAPGAMRRAVRDTEVLGHRIPAGIDVFMMNNGPGYLQEDPFAAKIPEKMRAKTSRDAKDRAVPDWPVGDIGAFKPERWLRMDEGGKEVFDGKAGPTLGFGGGIRGCFGKKLAYMEMKIVFTLMVWSFELPQLPMELSGYGAWDKLTHKPMQCYARPRYLLDGRKDSAADA
ncbi:cytochrome P450 [Myriangium duriaei CBS 260.36]|uniref:Cytochrome P450 n=1 Tax=Myriangium duriaei CBS 260.36 TaxID=1168546 RepID=A0A9P4J235_9PEZI|nr:cytochrome P450 [Myriangium duriaei CBS 260.36]